jgi:hypothetical protein
VKSLSFFNSNVNLSELGVTHKCYRQGLGFIGEMGDGEEMAINFMKDMHT